MKYKDILLWGHSLNDFRQMFALSDQELQGKILDCCGGPDSFNAELSKQGGHVISCDPLFKLNKNELAKRIESVFQEMLAKVNANKERFTWNNFKTPEELAIARKKDIALFMDDFDAGCKEGRYQACDLPQLPYQHSQFDLGLCSHYLFANCPDQSVEFHLESIRTLCDVAKEVRIFPLLNSYGEIPDIVGPVMQFLNQMDYGVEIKAVPYEFQKKGNAMLRVWAQTCEVE